MRQKKIGVCQYLKHTDILGKEFIERLESLDENAFAFTAEIEKHFKEKVFVNAIYAPHNNREQNIFHILAQKNRDNVEPATKMMDILLNCTQERVSNCLSVVDKYYKTPLEYTTDLRMQDYLLSKMRPPKQAAPKKAPKRSWAEAFQTDDDPLAETKRATPARTISWAFPPMGDFPATTTNLLPGR